MSKTDFTKYMFRDEAEGVMKFNSDLFDSTTVKYKGVEYPVVMQKKDLFITKASERKDGKVSIVYSDGTTKTYENSDSIFNLVSEGKDNLEGIVDKKIGAYEFVPVKLLAEMRQDLEIENEKLKKDLEGKGNPQLYKYVSENPVTKSKKAKVVTGAVAGVLALGIAAGVGGWVANRFTQKKVTEPNAVSTENYTNWENFLAEQTGTEIVNGSLRGDEGAISFWAEKLISLSIASDSEVTLSEYDADAKTYTIEDASGNVIKGVSENDLVITATSKEELTSDDPEVTIASGSTVTLSNYNSDSNTYTVTYTDENDETTPVSIDNVSVKKLEDITAKTNKATTKTNKNIGYYTANLEMMEKWAKETSKDPVLNWVKSVAGKNDEWLRTFNPEVMTALKDSIANGKVKVVNEFSISQDEVANVDINGKTYNLNGFANDSDLTSVNGDRAAIIPNADGSRVEVNDVIDEAKGVVGKIAYAKILVGPSDYSKDATYVEKFCAVNIDDVKNMTEEQILSKVLNDGKIVAGSEQKLYNATARLNIVETKDVIVNAKEEYIEGSKEADELKTELKSKGIVNSNDNVVAKVGSDGNKEYIKVKNSQGVNDLYVIVRDENGKIDKNQTEKYSSIDSYTTDKNLKEVLVYTIAESIIDDKDEIYVKSNQVSKNGKFISDLDVMVVDSQAKSPTIYKAEDVIKTTTADKQGTQALVSELEARLNNTDSVILGKKEFNLQKGEVVAQQEEDIQKGEVVDQAQQEEDIQK